MRSPSVTGSIRLVLNSYVSEFWSHSTAVAHGGMKSESQAIIFDLTIELEAGLTKRGY